MRCHLLSENLSIQCPKLVLKALYYNKDIFNIHSVRNFEAWSLTWKIIRVDSFLSEILYERHSALRRTMTWNRFLIWYDTNFWNDFIHKKSFFISEREKRNKSILIWDFVFLTKNIVGFNEFSLMNDKWRLSDKSRLVLKLTVLQSETDKWSFKFELFPSD